MHKINFLGCPDSNVKVYLYIFVLAPTLLITLVANPGFFNHDELQKADHVLRFGFFDYLSHYLVLSGEGGFGTPIRPVSFFVQGLASLFLPNYPFVVHLIDVLIHAIVACLFFLVIISIFNNRTLAWWAVLIFIVSPLVIFSVGWPAALMDRLYVLFGLSALLAADKIVQNAGKFFTVVSLFCFASLSVLSKETAVIFPGVMFLFLLRSPSLIKAPRFWTAFVVWALPGSCLFLSRIPALVNSFQGKVADPYVASISNIPENLLVYFSYPFLITLHEGVNWVFVENWQFFIAIICHLLILVFITYLSSVKAFIAYIFSYFLFIFPVITIPLKGAHYLYASALPMSIGIAFIIYAGLEKRKYYYVILSSLFLIALIVHSLFNQIFIYHVGVSLKTAAITSESSFLSTNRPAEMQVYVLPGAPAHILYRLSTGREQLGEYYPVKINVITGADRDSLKFDYVFDKQCRVLPVIRTER